LVPTLVTTVETNQATPQLAHSWATLSPVAGIALIRFAGSLSFPSFLPVTRYTRPRLPSGGSLGPHFPTLVGTMLGYDCQRLVSYHFTCRWRYDTLPALLLRAPPMRLAEGAEASPSAPGRLISASALVLARWETVGSPKFLSCPLEDPPRLTKRSFVQTPVVS
jgi:hypothetical protein